MLRIAWNLFAVQLRWAQIIFKINILQSQFTEKGFKKAENSEQNVVFLLFLFTLNHIYLRSLKKCETLCSFAELRLQIQHTIQRTMQNFTRCWLETSLHPINTSRKSAKLDKWRPSSLCPHASSALLRQETNNKKQPQIKFHEDTSCVLHGHTWRLNRHGDTVIKWRDC